MRIIHAMGIKDFIFTLMDKNGLGGRELSRLMGKSPTYVSATFARNSTPRVDTFVSMLKALGYEVVVRKGSEEHLLSDYLDDDGRDG